MIRTLTLVENRSDNDNVEYSVNGNLPIDEAAKALIVIALHTELPKTEPEPQS